MVDPLDFLKVELRTSSGCVVVRDRDGRVALVSRAKTDKKAIKQLDSMCAAILKERKENNRGIQ